MGCSNKEWFEIVEIEYKLVPVIHDLSFLPFVLHVYIPYHSHHTQDNCSRSNHSCSLQNSPHLHHSDLNSKIQSHNMSYCICKLCPMNDGPRKHLTSFETWWCPIELVAVQHRTLPDRSTLF